jgi:hypothetical protein
MIVARIGGIGRIVLYLENFQEAVKFQFLQKKTSSTAKGAVSGNALLFNRNQEQILRSHPAF